MDGDGIMRQEFRCCEPFWREDLSSFQICSCSPDTGGEMVPFYEKTSIMCKHYGVFVVVFERMR